MINDLVDFINNLTKKQYEIIIGIDDKPKNGVDKLLQLTKLIDVFSQQHGV